MSRENYKSPSKPRNQEWRGRAPDGHATIGVLERAGGLSVPGRPNAPTLQWRTRGPHLPSQLLRSGVPRYRVNHGASCRAGAGQLPCDDSLNEWKALPEDRGQYLAGHWMSGLKEKNGSKLTGKSEPRGPAQTRLEARFSVRG